MATQFDGHLRGGQRPASFRWKARLAEPSDRRQTPVNAPSLCRRAGLALPIPQAEEEHERRSSGRWAGGVAALLAGSCLALPAAAVGTGRACGASRRSTGRSAGRPAGDRAAVALDWARANRGALGLTAADVDGLDLTARATSRGTGFTHLRYRLGGPRDPGLRRRAARQPRPRRARPQRDRLAGAAGRLGGAAARRRRGAARAPARRGRASGRSASSRGRRACAARRASRAATSPAWCCSAAAAARGWRGT